jgi:biopolymer transport protein TolQ
MNRITPLRFFLLAQLVLTAVGTSSFAETSTNVAAHTSGFDALLQASFIVQLVIIILASLSILCWGVAFAKYQEFKTLKRANDNFDTIFWKTTSLDEMYAKCDGFRESSHARLFKAAYAEMKKIAESPMLNRTGSADADHPQLSGLDNLERSLRKATEKEVLQMESRLTLLASTGSTGPFIGLFGTVWGIMNSFSKIAQSGSASLAAVAPGISEALIATAIGLAAAIPAVIIYNHFISQVKRHELGLNNFSADFLNVVKRNFFRG